MPDGDISFYKTEIIEYNAGKNGLTNINVNMVNDIAACRKGSAEMILNIREEEDERSN